KNVPDERDRFLEHIEQSASRLVRVVRSLMVLLRQRAQTETPRRVIVPVLPVLEGIAARLDPRRQRVSVACDRAAPGPAGRTLREQALENLVVNALRHGLGEVRLSCDGVVEGKATFTIADAGPGLPDEVLERIEKSRAPLGDYALSGSAGLGVSVAIQIVQVLGGELRARSSQKGSTLTLALPAARRLQR